MAKSGSNHQIKLGVEKWQDVTILENTWWKGYSFGINGCVKQRGRRTCWIIQRTISSNR